MFTIFKSFKIFRFNENKSKDEFLIHLRKHGNPTIRVVGRGGLVKSIKSVKESENYKKAIESANQQINAS